MKRGAVALLLVLAASACSTEPEPASTRAPSPSATADAAGEPTGSPAATRSEAPAAAEPEVTGEPFDVDAAMDHVRALAVEIGPRFAGTDGDRKGAKYIASRIERLGWNADEQSFPLPQGGTSTNVIGKPPGFSTDEPYLIVGGHHDSIGGAGANDNATGIAVALEIIRRVNDEPAPLPVVFIAFGAEERQPAPDRPHHVGSVYYVSKMSKAAQKNLAAFVNLDMIGHGDKIICGRLSVGPTNGTRRCVRYARELEIPAEERVLPDWSDHGSFQVKGMNIAWLWTGETPCCYHNARDTIDHVRPPDVERSGRLAMAIVRSYTGSL